MLEEEEQEEATNKMTISYAKNCKLLKRLLPINLAALKNTKII